MKLSKAIEWHREYAGFWTFRWAKCGTVCGYGVKTDRRFHVFDLLDGMDRGDGDKYTDHEPFNAPIDFADEIDLIDIEFSSDGSFVTSKRLASRTAIPLSQWL